MSGTAAVQRAPSAEAEVAAPSVRAQGLRRDYGDLVALRDVTFGVAPGETLALLGPNGSGKTTLLRILATLLRPTVGEASVLGCELPREAWRARGRVGYLGHSPLLYRDLTVDENLHFHARLHGLERAEERIAELLERVRLSRRRHDLVRDLSAGLVQRAAICRASLHEPELLLLDEPHAHLDPEAAGLVEPLIGRAHGRTRVVASHDVEPALASADRVLTLRAGGTVAFEGPASGLSAGDARAIYRGAA